MTKSQEMMSKLTELKAQAQALLDSNDVAGAKAKMTEINDMKAAVEMQIALENEEKSAISEAAPKVKPISTHADETANFANAYRAGFKASMTEGTMADGGYTVPEDISTKINHFKEEYFDLSKYVRVVPVSTNKGRRTYQTKATATGFSKVGEMAAIGALAEPHYTKVEFAIDKYAGYIPMSNELKADSDANIVNELSRWFALNSTAGRNKAILDVIKTKAQTPLATLNDIKKVVNVTLGSAYKPTTAIYVNDDGLNFLDSLEDSNGRPLLNADPTAPVNMRLRVGANLIPVINVPNSVMPSVTVEGESDAPDVTTAPIIIGDLAEAVTIFDRQHLSIAQSDTATVGSINAFEQDVTVIRGIERFDCVKVDADAFVYGGIVVS